MFKLRNKAGNVYKIAATAHKRDELLARGYIPVEKAKATPKKPKAKG